MVTLVERAASEPETVLRQAISGLVTARGVERARLRLAAALAHVELGEPGPAARHARLALAGAQRAGAGQLAASVRLVRAWLAVDRGRPRAALAELDRAVGLRGVELAKARCLRGAAGFVLREPVREVLTAALAGLRAEPRWRANALIVRGADACYRGQAAQGRKDFVAAQRILTELGMVERAAVCLHNQGFAALRAGDSVAALRLFEAAERAGADPLRHPEMLLDRAEALAPEEAMPVLRRAVVLLAAAEKWRKLAEAKLALARCALRGKDFAAAEAAAREAAELFRRQRRPSWTALASAVGMRAAVARGEVDLVRGARVARWCARRGWAEEAAELRLALGRAARGSVAGRRLLAGVGAGPVCWRARAELAWGQDAAGLGAADRGTAGRSAADRGAAGLGAGGWRGDVLRACRRGLAERWNPELAELGLAAAMTGGNPATVLRWARRCRGDDPDGPRAPALEYFLHQGWVWCGWQGRVTRQAPLADLRQELAGVRLIGGPLERLDRLLVPESPTGPVLVVAPVELAGVPWNGLPSLAGRAVSVLPPGWEPRPVRQGAPVWVAGPGLPGAEAEVRELHRRFGGELLVGATVARVLRAVARAGLVHVAAHGRGHGGCLELADGWVRVAEVLDRAGGPVVLSACGAGRALGRGRGVVVASVLDVADDRVGPMMLDLHERLRQEPPAAALAAVQAGHGHRGFVCVGQVLSLPRRSRASSRTSSRLQ